MGNWPNRALGDQVEVWNRKRVPLSRIKRERRQGPFRYFGAQGVIDHIDDYIFDGEFILVAEDGENLRSRKQPVAFLESGRFWVNNHAHIIRARDGVADNRFLTYAINHSPLAGSITGAAQPKLTKANLEALELPLPALESQQAVGDLLGAFDRLITTNERRIEILEGLARSLYREWFVRFRFPGYRSQNDLGAGKVDEWRATTLGEVLELRYGKPLPAGRRRPGPVPVVSSAGVVDAHDESIASCSRQEGCSVRASLEVASCEACNQPKEPRT